MELLQKFLLWGYVLICFMIVWYGVALVLAFWEWMRKQRSLPTLVRTGLKFVVVWSAAWLVTVVGAATSA